MHHSKKNEQMLHNQKLDNGKYIKVLAIGNYGKNALDNFLENDFEYLDELDLIPIDIDKKNDIPKLLHEVAILIIIITDLSIESAVNDSVILDAVFQYLSSLKEEISIFYISPGNENNGEAREIMNINNEFPICFFNAMTNEPFFHNKPVKFLRMFNRLIVERTLINFDYCDLREFISSNSSINMNALLTECQLTMTDVTNMMMAVQDRVRDLYTSKSEINSVFFFLYGGCNLSMAVYEFMHFALSRFVNDKVTIQCSVMISEEEKETIELLVMLG